MTVLYLLYAIVGISVIIFIHELGHFLAAKKVGVRVDKFSVGFDPTVFGVRLRLLSFRRGETEYVVGMVPFGGYVKMAGETAMEAADQPTQPQPDWLIAKSPGARALVFAAGAIFNIVSAFFFFVLAFSIGVNFFAPVLGWVEPGSPAWRAGLRPGDRILAIDGARITEHTEVAMAVAFADDDAQLQIEYSPAGAAESRTVSVLPKWNRALGFRTIGVKNSYDPKIVGVTEESAASRAGLQRGERVVGARFGSVELVDLPSFETINSEIESYLGEVAPGGPIELLIESEDGRRDWNRIELRKTDTKDKVLGVLLRPVAQVIEAVHGSSPLGAALRAGDRVLGVDGATVRWFDLTFLAGLPAAGDAYTLDVEREGGSRETVTVPRLELHRGLAQGELFIKGLGAQLGELGADSPLASSGLLQGDVIYKIGSKVVSSPDDVREGLAGAERATVAVIRDGARTAAPVEVVGEALAALRSDADSLWNRVPVLRVRPSGPAGSVGIEDASRIVRIGSKEVTEWDDLIAAVKAAGSEPVEIAWIDPAGESKTATTTIESEAYERLGLEHQPLQEVTQRGPIEAALLGIKRVKIVAQQVFLTLRGLLTRQVEAKNLSGPVGIVHIIYRISEYGTGYLIYILALISVNLGILNLLPIPILDGGHLLFLAIEKIKGSPVDVRIQEIATTIAFFLIISLALFVTYHDIRRLIP